MDEKAGFEAVDWPEEVPNNENENLSDAELDAKIAEKLYGYEIAALDWPCGYDPEGILSAASDKDNPASWEDEPRPVYQIPGAEEEKKKMGPEWASFPMVDPVPFYSREIATVWFAVQKLREKTTLEYVHVAWYIGDEEHSYATLSGDGWWVETKANNDARAIAEAVATVLDSNPEETPEIWK